VEAVLSMREFARCGPGASRAAGIDGIAVVEIKGAGAAQ